MPHSKTPGGSGISDKEAKKQAQGTYSLYPSIFTTTEY